MESEKVNELMAITYIVMGLRFSEDVVEKAFLGIHGIEVPTTYQYILNKGIVQGEAQGALKEQRRSIVKLANAKFGNPDPKIRRRINAITNSDRLDKMLIHVLTANSWDELFAAP